MQAKVRKANKKGPSLIPLQSEQEKEQEQEKIQLLDEPLVPEKLDDEIDKLRELVHDKLLSLSDEVDYEQLLTQFHKASERFQIPINQTKLKAQGYEYFLQRHKALEMENQDNARKEVGQGFQGIVTQLKNTVDDVQQGNFFKVALPDQVKGSLDQAIKEASFNNQEIMKNLLNIIQKVSSKEKRVLQMDKKEEEDNPYLNMRSLVKRAKKLRIYYEQKQYNKDPTRTIVGLFEQDNKKRKEAQLKKKLEEQKQRDNDEEVKDLDSGVKFSHLHPFIRHWGSKKRDQFLNCYLPTDPRSKKLKKKRKKKRKKLKIFQNYKPGGNNPNSGQNKQDTFLDVMRRYKFGSQTVVLRRKLHDQVNLTYSQIDLRYPHYPSVFNYKVNLNKIQQRERERIQGKALEDIRIPISKELISNVEKYLELDLEQVKEKQDRMTKKLQDKRNFFKLTYRVEFQSEQTDKSQFVNLLQWCEEGMRQEIFGGVVFRKRVSNQMYQILSSPDFFSEFNLPPKAYEHKNQNALREYFEKRRKLMIHKPRPIKNIQKDLLDLTETTKSKTDKRKENRKFMRKNPKKRKKDAVKKEEKKEVKKEVKNDVKKQENKLEKRAKLREKKIKKEEDKKEEVKVKRSQEEELKQEINRTIREKLEATQNYKLIKLMNKFADNAKNDPNKLHFLHEELSRVGIDFIIN